MRGRLRLGLVAAASISLAAGSALADEVSPAGAAPLQLSFASPVQLVAEPRDVAGLRLTLFFGKNADVAGLDIAVGGTSSRAFTGVQLALFGNYVEGKAAGVQAGLFGNAAAHISGVQIGGLIANLAHEGGDGLQLGVSNVAGGKFNGVQIGLIGSVFRSDWTTLNFTGVQIGAMNLVNGSVTGLQVGAFNAVNTKEGSFAGVQIGVLNIAGDCRGLQIGVVNSCSDMSGVQIGLINHISEGAIPWLPIVNAKF